MIFEWIILFNIQTNIYLWDISIQWSVIHESAVLFSHLVILEKRGKKRKQRVKIFFLEYCAGIRGKMKKK